MNAIQGLEKLRPFLFRRSGSHKIRSEDIGESADQHRHRIGYTSRISFLSQHHPVLPGEVRPRLPQNKKAVNPIIQY